MDSRLKFEHWIAWAAVVANGLALGITAFVHLIGIGTLEATDLVLAIVLILAGMGLAYLLVGRIIWPGLKKYNLRTRLAWVLVSLVAGLYLVLTLPLVIYPKPNLIVITGLAEKNPQAQASEVFLTELQSGRIAAGQSLSEMCEGDWEARDELLVFYASQPSRLECVIESEDVVELTFVKHPWSGMVQVEYAGKVVKQDLFFATGDQVEVSFPVMLSQREALFRSMMLAAATLSAAVILLAASLWLGTHSLKTDALQTRKPILWMLYALPMALVWFVNLLVYWPGFLSPDSVYQLEQIVNGQLYDWHPAFHTMLLWLLTRISFTPAPVAMVHILSLAGVMGWGLSVIESKGAPRWLTGLLAVCLALSPAAGLMTLTMWKDIAYSIAVLALTVMAFLIFASRGRWLDQPGRWIALGITAALPGLFRHNGGPVALGFLVVLALIYLPRWRIILLTMALALGVWFVVKGPLYWFAGVDTTYVTRGQFPVLPSLNISLISWHIRSGTPLTSEEQQLYLQIYPRNAPRDTAAMINKESETHDLALRLTQRNPRATLAYFLERSSLVFQILRPPPAGVDNIFLEMYPNDYGIEQVSRIPVLQPWIERLVQLSERPELDWFFWRNAFWMNLLLFACAVTWARTRSWKVFIVALPVLLNALPYAIYNPEYSARYILPTLLAGPLFGVFLLLVKPRLEPSET